MSGEELGAGKKTSPSVSDAPVSGACPSSPLVKGRASPLRIGYDLDAPPRRWWDRLRLVPRHDRAAWTPEREVEAATRDAEADAVYDTWRGAA